ncbi:MAG: GTP 3',8-cyclase MoaA [Candidatus Omnitrophica bacterium]|nr:GTP 3',8-cyclase MoaA [Candidatus Omnitrophota bacterium]
MEMKNKIDYLRLSITDRCNLNCLYCTPLKKDQFLTHDEVLRYEEMVKIVEAFVTMGVRYVRITGGEPLIKKNITDLVSMIRDIKGLREIALTTNGIGLKDKARQLKEAGLDRINISINTLKEERYIDIAGRDYFKEVWAGIHSALKSGLDPIKLNVVVMKGINDDEILDFVRLTFRYPLNIRFIELFPTTERSEGLTYHMMKNTEIKEKILDQFGEMRRSFDINGNGPAEYYRLKDSMGLIGFINSSSDNFCNECNRVRIDCAGRISPCLFSGHIYDLRNALRNGKNDELSLSIKDIFEMKSEYNKNAINNRKVEMSSIGG